SATGNERRLSDLDAGDIGDGVERAWGAADLRGEAEVARAWLGGSCLCERLRCEREGNESEGDREDAHGRAPGRVDRGAVNLARKRRGGELRCGGECTARTYNAATRLIHHRTNPRLQSGRRPPRGHDDLCALDDDARG